MQNDLPRKFAAAVHQPRLRRAIVWFVIAVLLVGLVGFLVLPPLARPALERSLSTALDRKVTIERLKVNPFALSATLSNVTVGERGVGPPMATVAELYASTGISSLFRWAPVLRELRLTQPYLHLVRNADKSYNFQDLLDEILAPGPTPRFSLSNIQIIDGRIDFDDRPEHKVHKVTELNIGIPFLSSLPTQADIKVEPTFSALVNGRAVAVTGETQPFEDTHQTVLHWHIQDLSLPFYLDYLPGKLPAKVNSGRLDASVDLTYVGRGQNPPQFTLAGDFELADLAVSERSGEPLLRVPSLVVAVDRLDLTGNSAELRTIAAHDIEVDARRTPDGEWNLASLAPPRAAPKGGTAPFRFHVGSIALKHAVVRLADGSVKPAFAATLSDINLDVSNLSSQSAQKAAAALTLATDGGGHLSYRGTIGLSPMLADGQLQFTGIRLALLYPYYASALNLAVDDGSLDVSSGIRFDGGTGLALNDLAATVHNLNMRLPDEKQPLWRVSVLAGTGGLVDVSKQAIHFDSVESHGAVATVRRAAGGEINFDRIIRTPAAGAPQSTSAEGWHFEARKVMLDDFSATFTDESVTPPARISMTRIAGSAENISNAAKEKGRVTLQMTVNKRGAITLSGPLATAPFAASLNIVAKNIDLVPFQPYIARSVRVVLTGGAVSAHGVLDIDTANALHGGFKGDVLASDVAALDEANETDLLKWRTLALNGINAQFEPLAVTIGEIALDEFFARLLLNETGEFNLQQLARSPTTAPAPPTPTAGAKTVELAASPGTSTPWLKLGKATLTPGSIYFTDHFIRPNYSADLSGLAGSLSTLAFDQPADIELRGKVQESAEIRITGRINPLTQNLFLDLKAEASDIELPPMTPYSDKYVGYGIEKGKLSMKVHYLIDNRKLTAENSVVLDQLTFGNKVESPDAIKVPVLLAVALLKDRNGVIQFDLPISGSLDDPQFSVGGIVFRAIVNLLVKIVTSPFALLGSLGGHSEELAYIEFAPGSAALDTPSEEKIKAIAKALDNRPALKLDIAGRVDPDADREGLKRSAVDHEIRLQKFDELKKHGEPPSSVDAVEVTADERNNLLKQAYKDASFAKPRNAIGLPQDLPPAEMEALLLANVKVSDEDLRRLAERRGQTVQNRLAETEHVPGERMFLVEPRVDAQGIKDKGKATRVDFALH